MLDLFLNFRGLFYWRQIYLIEIMIVEENKTLKEQIIKKTKDTLESSSIHAIPNIVRSKSKALRLIIIVFSNYVDYVVY